MTKNFFKLNPLGAGLLLYALSGLTGSAAAKEGMKVPPALLNSPGEIISAGLEIPINKLYNSEGTGLNNAIVLFGRGCTGEIISAQGLLLTNHHCGYGTVQGLASVEHDYFATGFWAMSNKEEIPCPGLTVTFIREMEDVTDRILSGISDEMSDPKRDSIIKIRIASLEKGFRYTRKKDAQIRSFANGNQYWVIISETYRDIRLVGFPPNGIGAFGGDTDNWMWPRHTGDFSMFRVYADEQNKPADYSAANKPYRASEFLTINANGYKEGDFTLVYGFPGVTQEYISSLQLNQVIEITDPIRVDARTRKLAVWTEHMNKDREVFLKYTSKRAGIANGWKKWQGELRGLQQNNVGEKKKAFEQEFQAWANTASALPYAKDLLANLQAKSTAKDRLIGVSEYIREAVLGIELVQQGAELDRLLKTIDAGLPQQVLQDSLRKLASGWDNFHKNYDAGNDKDVFIALMPLFMEKCAAYAPSYYKSELARFGKSYTAWAGYVYDRSLVPHQQQLLALIEQPDRTRITSDPAWKLYSLINKVKEEQITQPLKAYNDSLVRFNRLYMKAQMVKSKYVDLYPDANSTLRVAFGKVKGIDPEGPAGYSWQTTLDEAVLKHNADVSEFDMPEKLRQLQSSKDYGRWEENGTVPIAFIADNHTSGGNSGSPVLNARGELIGTNFDRVWEGTMSDYYFDERQCRNITVDIRYTLFIVEKFGGAGWLLNELRFAKAPVKKAAIPRK